MMAMTKYVEILDTREKKNQVHIRNGGMKKLNEQEMKEDRSSSISSWSRSNSGKWTPNGFAYECRTINSSPAAITNINDCGVWYVIWDLSLVNDYSEFYGGAHVSGNNTHLTALHWAELMVKSIHVFKQSGSVVEHTK